MAGEGSACPTTSHNGVATRRLTVTNERTVDLRTRGILWKECGERVTRAGLENMAAQPAFGTRPVDRWPRHLAAMRPKPSIHHLFHVAQSAERLSIVSAIEFPLHAS